MNSFVKWLAREKPYFIPFWIAFYSIVILYITAFMVVIPLLPATATIRLTPPIISFSIIIFSVYLKEIIIQLKSKYDDEQSKPARARK